ncbi:MAG: serine/threonine-protein kinase [Acidobacteriota bacterium]
MMNSRSTGHDSRERQSFYQRRVGVLGKVLTIVWLVGNLASASIYLAMGWWREYFTVGTALYWVALLICLAVWMICRRGELPHRAVRLVESASMMGSATAVALMGRYIAPQALELTARGAGIDLSAIEPEAFTLLAGLQFEQILVALMLGLAFGYVLRAALVPSSVRRTLWITVLAIVPLLALYVFDWLPVAADRALREATGAYQTASLVVNVLIWWTLVTIVCVSISRIIHNLRREIRQAMRLGQYTLEKKLGEGGMGTVYRASHAMMRRPTAVKLLPLEKMGQASLARFEREVQETARLTHPNTITIYDYGRTPDGVFYYAMELLDGASLEAVVEEDGPQPPGRVVRVMEMVAGGLAEAHKLGIIHRDIKPANIYLCRQGGELDIAKVLDFGLVKVVEGPEDANLTHDGVVTGTPQYLAPEAITDPDNIDGRSDLYSLGAAAYYMLTGQQVFTGNIVEICGHHLHTEPIPPSERLGREVPFELEAVVMQCLAKNPDDRPQSAGEIRARLAASLEVPRWRQVDAQAWWQAYGEAIGSAAEEEPDSDVTRTLAVDPGQLR